MQRHQRHASFGQALRQHFDKSPVVVWPALVKSVEGLTCTVTFLTNDLEVDEVRLRPDVDATEGVILTPRVGSLVYVATIENSLDNLFVCMVSEVDAIDALIDKTMVSVSKDGVVIADDKTILTLAGSKATLEQDKTNITLTNGTVSVKNDKTSLKDLFDGLTSLLTSLKVITPVMGAPTPSVSLDPGTTAAITQLKTKVTQLLA